MTDLLLGITVWAVPVVLAITLHEAAHGYAARAMGDDTAERMGRISINPLRHVDPFGTVILPALLLAFGGVMFGWAKPVPVNFFRLRPFRPGVIIVALAGPAANLLLALIAILALWLVPLVPVLAQSWLFQNLENAIYINILLMVFNLLPIPPLDGGRVLTALLPGPVGLRLVRLDRIGMVVVLLLVFVLPLVGTKMGLDLDLLRWLVQGPVIAVGQALVGAFGPGG